MEYGTDISGATYATMEVVYLDIMKEEKVQGVLNYRQLEQHTLNLNGTFLADCRSSVFDGTPAGAYKAFGMRLCITHETPAKARNLYIVYGLLHPTEVSQDILRAAIADFHDDGLRSSDARRLIDLGNHIVKRMELHNNIPYQEEREEQSAWMQIATRRGGVLYQPKHLSLMAQVIRQAGQTDESTRGAR